MDLVVQLQGVVYSFVYGLLFSFLYSLINRLFYRYKKKIIRFIIQVCVGVGFGLTYYFGLLMINHGVLRIYFIISIIIGYIIYENYYAFGSLIVIENIIKTVKKILKPVYFIFHKIHGIIKKLKKKVRKWSKQKQKRKKEKTS